MDAEKISEKNNNKKPLLYEEKGPYTQGISLSILSVEGGGRLLK
jgi:hypothetical protein